MLSQPKRIRQKTAFILLITVFTNLTTCGIAQDAPESSQKEPQTTIDQQWDAFLELAIQTATNFESRANSDAIYVVVNNNISDARFDEPIRTVLKSRRSLLDNQSPTNMLMLSRAIRLLPQSKIAPREQIALLLDFLSLQDERHYQGIKVSLDSFSVSSDDPVIRTIAHLDANQETLVKELAQRYERGSPQSTDYVAAGLTQRNGECLIPFLFAASESDDPLIRDASFLSLAKILEDVKRSTRPEIETSSTAIDSKTLKYVKRIIQRNDTNKDGMLSPHEWKNMLVDPSAADTNNDQKITVEEYAAWMLSRQRK